ncbi:SMC-Scp complex subunit ScpB [Methylobacter sp. YRD-M1]|uniref:SMC-Scp complex subunit ScpB n=1 Tax=Methylobacter sp. YRD-M1 TaxID=2911520 RepID=UPI00227D6AC1|nr:SMC-Scp complex subunit ScpB [Methylobacter sp. YRD-M1]WAK00834.1 SMC-Scp complex subunit ScpB [Methylobacter sp. YRD-M1]
MPSYESEEPAAPPEPKKERKPRKVKPVQNLATDSDTTIIPEPVGGPPVNLDRLRAYVSHKNRRRQCQPIQLPESPPVSEQPEFSMEIKRIVEAILFAASKPMTAKQVQQVFPEIEQPELPEIQSAIDAIVEEYRFRPVELKKVASGYRFQVKQELSRWVARLFEEKPPKYSRALLETLAIIAYRQPVTRGDIEDIRGVSVSSSIMQTLIEREWVRIVAYKEAPGRPAVYGTTKQFLDYFNIASLDELPTLQEIQNLDLSMDNGQQPMQVKSEEQETSEQFAETAE